MNPVYGQFRERKLLQRGFEGVTLLMFSFPVMVHREPLWSKSGCQVKQESTTGPLPQVGVREIQKANNPVEKPLSGISALRGTTHAGPHWTASFSRGGPAAGGLDILGETVRRDMLVELSHRFIHLRDYSTTTVNEGDKVETIHLAFCG